MNGTVSGDAISFHVLYTGTNAGYQFDATGTIAGNGLSMAGVWDSGTWTGTGAAAQLPLYVDDDLIECPDAQYTSIQPAVNAAVSGGQVIVCAGTYTEQIVINKNLTLQGAGANVTIVKAPGVLVGDANGSLNIVTVTGPIDVEIVGLSLTGPGPSSCGSIHMGIFVRDGAHANIHDNKILDIRDEPLSGCQNGAGVFVGRQLYGTTGTAEIVNNVISGYQKGGIVIDNTGSSANVIGNSVTGVGPTSLIAQNGIQVSRGATAVVQGNNVSGNACDHPSCGPDPVLQTQSVGILLYLAGSGTEVGGSGNTVDSNDVGIYNLAGGTLIKENILNFNRYGGIFLDEGDALVSNNTITGGNIGVGAISYDSNTANSMGMLTGNSITGTGKGVEIIDENPADAELPLVTANFNSIAGNTFGFDNPTPVSMNAEDNWWGACSGPFHSVLNPGGAGNPVSDNVDFIPWSTDRCGTLIIVKDAIPDDAQDFDFTSSFGPFSLDDDGDPGLPNSQTFTPLEPGVYSVDEIVPGGWDLTSAVCDDGSPVSAIDVSGGETVTCTFTNTKKGKIIIEKQTLPDLDPQVFLFSGDVGGILGDGQTAEQVVVPGMYASREDVPPPGWDLTSIVCDDQDSFGDLPTATAIFNVAPGETVKCIFTNTKRGKLVVNKTTYPAHNPQVFAIEASGTGTIIGGGLANVTHDSSHIYEVTPGTYSVVETVPAGWMMISNTCNNKVVGPGQNKSCTIKNKKISRLTVEKTTVGGVGTFDFTGDVGSFQLTTTQPNMPVSSFFDVFVDINGSNLTVNESVSSGWSANQSSCMKNLTPGETETCSFVNTKKAKLTVNKIVVNDNGGTAQVSEFALKVGTEPVVSGVQEEFAPGNYQVTETGPAGYAPSFSGACDAGGNVVLNPGDSKTCTITNNDLFGSISGVKYEDKNADGTRDLGEPGLPGWIIYIDTNNNGDKDPGEPFKVTGANGNYKFVGLLAGTYFIREKLKPNWNPTQPASGKYTVVLVAEQEVKGRNFGNYKPGKIMGMKFEDKNNNGQKDPGEPGLKNWDITLKQNGNVIDTKPTNNAGKYSFTDLVPGLYEVSETVKPGWIQTFPGGAGIHQVDVQSGQTSSDVDFGNFKLGVIKGQKFNDKNGNGKKNGQGEPGLPGWTINLINLGNGQQQSVVTGAGGNYAFGGLMPGNYMLWEQLQTFWIPINPPGGVYQQITITTSGQVIQQRSFGNKRVL